MALVIIEPATKLLLLTEIEDDPDVRSTLRVEGRIVNRHGLKGSPKSVPACSLALRSLTYTPTDQGARIEKAGEQAQASPGWLPALYAADTQSFHA
jgi:hypothetical protein